MVFIHRFGSSLNAHLHFHACILDGVFAPALAADGAVGVVLHAASGLDAAMLLARIYAAFPLRCSFGHAEMRSIACITAPRIVRQILAHQGEPTQPPRIAPARGPPLWAAAAAAPPAGNDPHWELATQPAPEIEFSWRLTWCCATSSSGWVCLCLRRTASLVLGLDSTIACR